MYNREYVDAVYRNRVDDDTITPAVVSVASTHPIVTKSMVSRTDVAVERFRLQRAMLPIFDTTRSPMKVGVGSTGGAVSIVDVVFTTQYIYDLRELAFAISESLDAAASSASAPAEPVFFFGEDGKARISVTEGFLVNGNSVFLDKNVLYYFNFWNTDGTLRFEPQSPLVAIQGSRTLNLLSPVHLIQIQSIGLAVKQEHVPATPGTKYSQNTESYLVDYQYNTLENAESETIDYVAGMSDHRWHDLLAEVREFTLEFLWLDYDGISRPVMLEPGGGAFLKLLFREYLPVA